ncbi:MAG: tRNA uridine(34) 5-carboxymethylaminomethyl modification radical SAM/GNAT enzyme Elp3 [Candidatus Buchananbacteria bacterium]
MNTNDKKLKIIISGLVQAKVKNRTDLINIKRKFSNSLNMPSPLNSDLLRIYYQLLRKKQIKADSTLTTLLRKREIRTLSGVAVITVLTKPYPCPGRCVYCPNEAGMPKSYLSNEPAAARAKGVKFNPATQVKVRLQALAMNGHETDKVELIVLGGTWSCYPKKYQTWFIKRCFEALNGRSAKTLAAAQKLNETAKHRCVGLTLETRPDFVTQAEIKNLRELGCTRVELGVQSIYDSILKLNQRGQTVNQTIQATRLLKEAGFKVMFHMMPNLPGTDLKKDLQMFKDLFSRADFRPDLLKIYPCVVTKNSVLYRWYKNNKFKPYTDSELKKLLIKIKLQLPKYVRLTRLIRDIPAESIVAGNKITNLRQEIDRELKKMKKYCQCIRCREAGHQIIDPRADISLIKKIKNPKFNIKKYRASQGTEYFLSFDSKDNKILYAFLRLRINDNPENNFIDELKNAAIIRELHTFGELAPLGKKGLVQHLGLGKKLLAQAEAVAKKNNLKKIAVISGIGVREYYKKFGYQLKKTYLVKNLK